MQLKNKKVLTFDCYGTLLNEASLYDTVEGIAEDIGVDGEEAQDRAFGLDRDPVLEVFVHDGQALEIQVSEAVRVIPAFPYDLPAGGSHAKRILTLDADMDVVDPGLGEVVEAGEHAVVLGAERENRGIVRPFGDLIPLRGFNRDGERCTFELVGHEARRGVGVDLGFGRILRLPRLRIGLGWRRRRGLHFRDGLRRGQNNSDGLLI